MPAPDGYQILRILRARPETRDLPVVVLTALDARGRDREGLRGRRRRLRAQAVQARSSSSRACAVSSASARRWTRSRARRRTRSVVLELTQALASNLDFRGILFTVVQRIADVAKIDRVSIVLVREQENVGYVVAASDDEQLRDLPIDLTKYPEIQQVLTSGEPLVVEDAATHPLMEIVRTTGAGARPASRRSRSCPSSTRASRWACSSSARGAPARSASARSALCQTIASAMAIALRNARVLQSLRDQTQQVTVARFEAERRMRSLQRYADFFDSSADGIVVIDAEGRLLFSNPKAREITGYDEQDLARPPPRRHLRDRGGELAHDLRVGLPAGRVPEGRRHPDRRRATSARSIVNVSFASVLREDGAVLCSFRDVTKQREVEAELVKTKDFLQRVIDSSVDAIISADLKGSVVLFNRAAERIYGAQLERRRRHERPRALPRGHRAEDHADDPRGRRAHRGPQGRHRRRERRARPGLVLRRAHLRGRDAPSAASASSPTSARRCAWSSASSRRRSRSSRRSGRRSSPSSPAPPRTS